MENITEIYKMLDWNNDEATQSKGIEYAVKMNNIDAFLQPSSPKYNKNIWDNCAKILSAKTDDELKPYLLPLFEWLQDLNWPGAFIICDRLNKFKDKDFLHSIKEKCKNTAKIDNNPVWLDNLNLIK